jgi:hypothetical protein
MKKAWFARTRRFYKPVSVYGWLITVAAVTYIVFSVFRIQEQSLKLNQALADIALQIVLTAVLYVLIAYATQKPEP